MFWLFKFVHLQRNIAFKADFLISLIFKKLICFLLFFLQETDDIGDIFQDQENMAAILLRKHLQSGDLLMVSYKNFLYFIKERKLLHNLLT